MLAYLAFFPKRALTGRLLFYLFLSLGTDLEVGCCGEEMQMMAKPKRQESLCGGSRIQNPSEHCGLPPLPVSTCSTRSTESDSDSLSLRVRVGDRP